MDHSILWYTSVRDTRRSSISVYTSPQRCVFHLRLSHVSALSLQLRLSHAQSSTAASCEGLSFCLVMHWQIWISKHLSALFDSNVAISFMPLQHGIPRSSSQTLTDSNRQVVYWEVFHYYKQHGSYPWKDLFHYIVGRAYPCLDPDVLNAELVLRLFCDPPDEGFWKLTEAFGRPCDGLSRFGKKNESDRSAWFLGQKWPIPTGVHGAIPASR